MLWALLHDSFNAFFLAIKTADTSLSISEMVALNPLSKAAFIEGRCTILSNGSIVNSCILSWCFLLSNSGICSVGSSNAWFDSTSTPAIITILVIGKFTAIRMLAPTRGNKTIGKRIERYICNVKLWTLLFDSCNTISNRREWSKTLFTLCEMISSIELSKAAFSLSLYLCCRFGSFIECSHAAGWPGWPACTTRIIISWIKTIGTLTPAWVYESSSANDPWGHVDQIIIRTLPFSSFNTVHRVGERTNISFSRCKLVSDRPNSETAVRNSLKLGLRLKTLKAARGVPTLHRCSCFKSS